MLGVELNYLLHLEVTFHPCLDPSPWKVGVGGLGPTLWLWGGVSMILAPLSRGFVEAPSWINLDANFLVKICNFLVNLGYSLGGIFDDIIYVNLRFFSLDGNPQFLWGNCISTMNYSILEKKRILCDGEEDIKTYFLKVFSLHFVRLYKRKEELFLCRCTPNWVSRVYLSLSLVLWSFLFVFL